MTNFEYHIVILRTHLKNDILKLNLQLEGGESTGETEGTTRSVPEETQIIRSVEEETQILTRALIGRFIQFVQRCIT